VPAEQLDCVVVGAGVVGLAIARELTGRGREVIVLEAERAIGRHASTRNSQVIHSGIYYPPGSLKARLCVRGREQLYHYCRERGVAHRRIGKLIVATTDAEAGTLAQYHARAAQNAVGAIELLTAAQARALEPAVRCVAALHLPMTGILDSHALLTALQAELEDRGGRVVLGARVCGGDVTGAVLRLQVQDGDAPYSFVTRTLVNAAGLRAPELCRSIAGFPRAAIPAAYFAKGHYYAWTGPSPFARLVYPVATRASLGVHVTIDLQGRARFGPDVEWIDRVDYRFDADRRAAFAAAIRGYYPDLDPDRLQPDYTGIRPKIVGPGSAPADFRIDTAGQHGVTGWINLFGIESPGLTASLAIAEEVARRCA
jgi:L-2-hydroxyglutarate oxidase LhgO